MYNYKNMCKELFTDEGQRVFLKIRDRTNAMLQKSGAVRLQEAIAGLGGGNWLALACLDRMVELGELKEVTDSTSAAQDRVFVAK